MGEYPPLEVKVWGEFACFTRPEMKVERVSYPVMTPSAARGVLESIFWKPEMRWRVREIWVLKPIRHLSLIRNEVNSPSSISMARNWSIYGGGYFAEEDRAQRHNLILRDVSYLIKADIELKSHNKANVAKYRDQFRRRVAAGQAFRAPYLGCREYAAFFGPPEGGEAPFDISDDLGRLLFDMKYESSSSNRATPVFECFILERGVLRIPQEMYDRLDKEEGPCL